MTGDRVTTRRRFLAAVGGGAGLAATAGPTGVAAGRGAGFESGVASAQADLPAEIGVETVAEGFASPVGVAFPGDGQGYVVDQMGQIYGFGSAGRDDEPFLDVTDRMVEVGGYSEQGLLGLAFHPDYPEEGRAFVRYSAPARDGTPSGYSHTFVLSEFDVSGDPPRADPDSERAVLEIPQPQSNHNAGDIAFGPDGYLYVGVGDGGAGGDQGTGHVEDWYDAVGGGNGQDLTENLLGSVLRIDVDGREEVRGEQRAYAIPEDNPLVGREGLDEQWAWGLRNPWRFSFDDGRLFAADVGQDRYEEVNLLAAGGNYGWNVREGTECYRADDCPTTAPDEPPYDGQPLTDPIVQYGHTGDGPTGSAVIGGYVARDDATPELRGRYVFADWQSGGDLFVASPPASGDGTWSVEVVPMTAVDGRQPGGSVLGFGRDGDGAVYVCTTDGGDSGAVHRLVPADGSDESESDEGGGDGDGGGNGATDGGDGDGDDGATGGDGEDGPGRTASPGQPGFGALAGLLGVGGAAGYLLADDGD